LLFVSTEEDKQLTELFEKNPDLLEGWGKKAELRSLVSHQ
jgi:hypothetical protein